MPLLTPEDGVAPDSPSTSQPSLISRFSSRLLHDMGPEVSWSRTTLLALAALVVVWAARMFGTWATWGHLTIDCGREMYVPTVLAEGQTLYRDVWYPYNPLAPYLNSFLFQLFGIHLHVLYWAGSLAALGCAVFLYLAGLRLGFWLAGWTAAAVMLVQAFQPFIFSFPLPYSFAAVYGCLTACMFLWLAIGAATSESWMWMFGAGSAAAVAMLLKLEYGLACYGAVALLMVLRGLRQKSWASSVPKDLAAIMPGIAVCGAVGAWMVSLAGADFITQENLQHWPTSHFMQAYGKTWLEFTGMSVSAGALMLAALRTIVVGGVGFLFYWFLRRKASDSAEPFLMAGLGIGTLAMLANVLPWQGESLFRIMFFPQDMVLYEGLAAAALCAYLWRAPVSDGAAKLAVLLTFATLLASRVLLGMVSAGYPVYYNGPAVLAFLLLARAVIPWSRSRRFMMQAEGLLCFACLTAVVLHASRIPPPANDWVLLKTNRGTIRVEPFFARNYQAAIAFMKEKASQGERVLSVPEDASLYVLSETHSPTRVFVFTPGVLAPGKMTEKVIGEIERARVRYVLWSNRRFEEYGVPIWGKDVDRELGDYLRAHYRRVGLVAPLSEQRVWNASVWERKPLEEPPAMAGN